MSRVERSEVDLPVWERSMNAEQLAVIRHEGGPLANFAGAGSGKTRALVHRVVRLVDHLGVAADRIFCVTFSRAGADEMTSRIRQLGCPGVEVKTWHAFCGRVLREEGTPQGSWTVDEKDRHKSLVKKAMGYQHVNWVGGDLTKVRRFIGVCKANLWEFASEEGETLAKKTFGPGAQKAIRTAVISQRLVEEAQLLTFDDMLVFVARLFAEDDEVRLNWAAKFDYVLQDEAQDANRAQVTLATQLAKDHRNYMIVGDPGQAVFGFRGASPEYLTGFPAEWDARVITMAKNYRSGSEIVRVANNIIREGAHRLPEDMTAERGVDGLVEVVAADTLDDEATHLVEFCKKRLADGKSLADVCVLYRLNAQSRAPEEAFLREKIPYVILGGVNFYERKEVKDLLAYLRLASGRGDDGDAVKRCINAPFRYLGNKFVERMQAEAARRPAPVDWLEVADVVSRQERIQARQVESVNAWVRIVENLRDMVTRGVQVDAEGKEKPVSAADALAYVVRETRYVEWLEKEEGEEWIESSHGANIRELTRVAQSFTNVADLLDFVELQVSESRKQKGRTRGEKCVTMMSAHRSKGLEWPVVWVVGCNDTILPHAKGDLEEERRIMYVACTRARDHLVVSHVRQMATRVGVREVEPSPFLSAFRAGAEEVDQDQGEECEDGTRVPSEEPALTVWVGPDTAVVTKADATLDEVVEAHGFGKSVDRSWLGSSAACADCGAMLTEHDDAACASGRVAT